MLDFLDNPLVSVLTSFGITFWALFMVYLEMPAKVVKKTGRVRSLGERISGLSRNGKLFLFIFIVSGIGLIASIIDFLRINLAV